MTAPNHPEPLPASTSKAVAKRSRTANKRTCGKAVEAPTSVASHEEGYLDERMNPKWAAIFADHPPLAVLPPKYLPHLDEGAGAPHFTFGWAFNRSHFLDIARRCRLTFDVEPCYQRRLGGCDTFNFGDLTEDHLSNPALTEYLRNAAFVFLYSYILQQTHARFTIRPMLSPQWKSMFALWTNYDIKEKYSTFKVLTKWPKVKKFMNEILNEGLPPGSERSEPLWYWSVDNDFVRP